MRYILCFIFSILFIIRLMAASSLVDRITFNELPDAALLSESALRQLLPVQIGSRAEGQRIQRSVESLYKTGYFKYVAVQTSPSRHGVSLFFDTQLNPTVKDIVFIGNTSFSSRQLLRYMSHRVGTVLNLIYDSNP